MLSITFPGTIGAPSNGTTRGQKVHWILLLMLTNSSNVGAATAVFDDEKACRAAVAEVTRSWGSSYNYSVCVPQGRP